MQRGLGNKVYLVGMQVMEERERERERRTEGGRRSAKGRRKRSSSKLFRRGIDIKGPGRRGSMGSAYLGSKQEVGSG